jgi:hypothetical protein
VKLRYRAILAVLIGPLALIGARTARAAEGACPHVVLEMDNAVSRRFPELPEEVRGAIDARADIDACARVEVTMSEGILNVEARLPDGRIASRRASRRADVVPTIEALLLLPRQTGPEPESAAPTPELESKPEPDPTPSESSPPAPRATSLRPPLADRLPADRGARTAASEPTASRLGFELSVFGDARIGDGQTGAGVGVLSFVDVSGWLAGFEGRSDQYGIAGGPAGTSLALSVLGGRRFRFENLALDVTGGPALALRAGSETKTAPATGMHVEPQVPPSGVGSDVPLELLFGARLHFATHSVFRTFVGTDAELALSSAREVPSDGPRLPPWTVGLSVGATVGTR